MRVQVLGWNLIQDHYFMFSYGYVGIFDFDMFVALYWAYFWPKYIAMQSCEKVLGLQWKKFRPFEATIDMVVHTSFFLGCLLFVFLLALISLFGQLKRLVLIGRPLILFRRFNKHMVKKGINRFTNVDYKSKGLSNEALSRRCKCCPPPPQGLGEGGCMCGSSAARSEDSCVQPAQECQEVLLGDD